MGFLDRKLASVGQQVQEQSAVNSSLPNYKPIDNTSAPELNKQQIESAAANINTPYEVKRLDTNDEVEIKPTIKETTPTLTPQQQYDQDYLNGMDEESRKRTQGIINAEGLQAQIDAAKWAEETPEQQAARLKKERNERNLVGAVGLLGALGNFAVAAGHPSGRSVPVLNVSDSVDKRQTAAQQQRELALAKLNKARGRKSQLIEQGYADTEKRKQLAEQREHQKKQLELQQQQLDRQAAKDANDLKIQLAKLNIEIQKAANDAGNAQARQSLLYAQRDYYKQRIDNLKTNGGGTAKYKGFIYGNGENVLDIPESRYNNAIYHAFSKLPQELQDKAVSLIYSNLQDENKIKENVGRIKTLGATDKQHWVSTNVYQMNAALEALIDEPAAQGALDVLKKASNAKPSKSDTQMNFSEYVEDNGEATNSEIVFNH